MSSGYLWQICLKRELAIAIGNTMGAIELLMLGAEGSDDSFK